MRILLDISIFYYPRIIKMISLIVKLAFDSAWYATAGVYYGTKYLIYGHQKTDAERIEELQREMVELKTIVSQIQLEERTDEKKEGKEVSTPSSLPLHPPPAPSTPQTEESVLISDPTSSQLPSVSSE